MSVYLVRPFITTDPFYSRLSERTLTITIESELSLSNILSDSILSFNVSWGEYESVLGDIVSTKEMLVSGSWIPYDGSIVMVVGAVWQVREIVTDGVTTRVFTSQSRTVIQRPLYPPVNTSVPRINHSDIYYRVGQTLDYTSPGSLGTWDPSADSYVYRWRRNGSNIAGATSATYTIVAADNNTTIVGQVRGINGDGQSDWISAVDHDTSSVGKEVRYTAPTANGSIPGANYYLSSGNQTINVTSYFTNAAGGTWSVSGPSASINQSGIVTITTGTLRDNVTITVTYTNSGGAANQEFNLLITHVPPVASGTIPDFIQQQAASQTASRSVTSYFTNAAGGTWSITSLAGVSINQSGIVSLDRTDLLETTEVTITYTNTGGYAEQTFNIGVVLAIPVNTGLPTITGTPKISETLSASNGTWSGTVQTYDFVWRRNGTPISGANSSTYLLQSSDDTTTITVAVTAGNTTGSNTAISSGVSITYIAPIAGEIPDVEYYLESGDQELDASAYFTNAVGGSWSIEGPGTIDSSGEITIATDTLRDHVAITVSYINSGGSDSATFYLDVVPVPLYPPINTVAPEMSGSFRIGGSDLTVSTGTWDPEADSYAYRWKRAGNVISGQTNNIYTPGPTDNNQVILAEVQGINDDGSSGWAPATGSATVLYLAPVASGSISDQIFNLDSGNQTVNAAPAFSNTYGGSWSASGGYSINSSGVVTIPTDDLLVTTITVTYTNSGGSDSVEFQVSIINTEMLNIVEDYAVAWEGEPPAFNEHTEDGFIWGYEETIIITGTSPVLGNTGSLLSDRVTWGSYLPDTGSRTITRQAKKNYDPWVLYSSVSSSPIVPGDTWQIRELVVHNDYNLSRTFSSNILVVEE